MPDRFCNTYRIPSTRLPHWNYSSGGAYFVTICTKNKEYYFGEIVDGVMKLSPIGQIAQKYWLEITQHFPHTELDDYIIMPNHIHGIIVINNDNCNNNGRDEAMPRLYIGKHPQMSKISPKPNTISSIIGSYKSICTKTINGMRNQPFFAWQPRFYDHIIRDDSSLNGIREYIQNNPLNWENDRNNPENLYI